MKLLLDTNVLVDYYAQREPFARDANLLQVAQIFDDVELWACPHSFPDIAYILHRVIPATRLRKMVLESLSFISVCTLDDETVREALIAAGCGIEDDFVEQCAQRIKADYIVTRDKEGFTTSKIDAISPGEFIARQKNKQIYYDIMGC